MVNNKKARNSKEEYLDGNDTKASFEVVPCRSSVAHAFEIRWNRNNKIVFVHQLVVSQQRCSLCVMTDPDAEHVPVQLWVLSIKFALCQNSVLT